jgi:hypothetical protein
MGDCHLFGKGHRGGLFADAVTCKCVKSPAAEAVMTKIPAISLSKFPIRNEFSCCNDVTLKDSEG